MSERLEPSTTAAMMVAYIDRVERTYKAISKIDLISSFFEKHGEGKVLSLKNYKWATAILDSRLIELYLTTADALFFHRIMLLTHLIVKLISRLKKCCPKADFTY